MDAFELLLLWFFYFAMLLAMKKHHHFEYQKSKKVYWNYFVLISVYLS